MEPNNPGNTSTTPSYPQAPAPAPTPPKRHWPFSRKVTIIVGIAAVVILWGVIATVLNKSSSNGGSQDQSSLYIKRPGYENVASGVGDPLALISKPDGKIIQYAGSPVIQACSVLTIKDIRDNGLKTSANQLPGAVTRVYFDGQSNAPLKKPSDFFLPFDDDSNRCQYYLENKGLVKVNVYQHSYSSKQAIDFEVGRDYTPIADVSGLKVYQAKAVKDQPDASRYILRGSGFDAQISITTPDANAKTALLGMAGKRLAEGAVGGNPVELFSYDSPIYQGKTVNPCDLANNDDFKKILGVEAGPLVQESLATAIGVIEDRTNKKLYNYAAHDCKRRSPEGSTRDYTLNVNVVTYETEEGAKAATAFERSPESLAKDLKEVTPTIGSESYFAATAGLDNALVFRKGRVVVHMALFLPQNNDAAPDDKRIEAMRPVAEAMANDRLKDF